MKLTKFLKNLWPMSGYNRSLSSTYPQVEVYIPKAVCLPIAGCLPVNSAALSSESCRPRQVIGFISACLSLLITGMVLLQYYDSMPRPRCVAFTMQHAVQ